MVTATASPARKSGGEYLNHELPSEMIAEIGKHLDLNSKLKLRLALVKSRQGDVVEMLKESFKVLYVSPSRTSLHNFERICQCPFFQPHILEVVFLPPILATEFRRSLEWYNAAFYWMSVAERRESWRLYQELIQEHWPAGKGDDLYVQTTLENGMSKLPRLRAATLSYWVTKDGCNRSTVFCRDYHSQEMVKSGHYVFSRDTAHQSARVALWTGLLEAGVEKFFTALEGVGIETLSCGTVPSDHCSMQICEKSPPTVPQAVTEQLKKLCISCEDSDTVDMAVTEETNIPWWMRLATGANTLQELEICIGCRSLPSWYDNGQGGHKVIDHFLRCGTYPALCQLTICSPDRAKPSTVDSLLMRDFLSRHSNTLRIVSIRDILPSTGKETSSKDIKTTFKALLKLQMPFIETFELSITRLTKHRRKECHCGPGEQCCDYIFPHCELLDTDFDELAEELEVESEGDGWDFGKVVMRSVSQT